MKVLGASVPGVAGSTDGRPSHDALRWSKGFGAGQVVVAMADGDGDPQGFRSNLGAQLAVDVAVQLGEDLLADCAAADDSAVEAAAESIAPNLVRQWRGRVADDVVARPFSSGELALVPNDYWLAYGTTLVLAVLAPNWILVEQLGSGDVLFSDAEGAVSRPVAGRPGTEAASLCLPEAALYFRAQLSHIGPGGPELVLMATDGLRKAYPNEARFAEIGPELLELVRIQGMEAVDRNLDKALRAASTHSGDDVTAAVVYLG